MTNLQFSEKDIIFLKQNPNTYDITASKLVLTLEFKKFFLNEIKKPGRTSIKILEEAGYPIEILGKPRMYAIAKSIKRQANSPEGLRDPSDRTRKKIEEFAKRNLENEQSKKAIKDLQDKVLHLEQQIEFLKKIQFLKM